MAIPQEFIDELLDRVDIVELIGQRVALKNRGNRHVACCPFHDEKTPSFSVDARKQFYYCFGCRASGTALSFVMQKDGLDFVSAVRQLAAQQGMEVPDSHQPQADSLRRYRHMADILDNAAQFFRLCLKENHTASQYLAQRHISADVAAHMRIGYAPPGWDSMQKHFGSKFSADDLRSVGLIKHSSGERSGHYDVFRDRLMFPIRNQKGQTVGFGGRALDKDNPAKYLNTPATDLFRKKSEVYGLYEVLGQADYKRDHTDICLVEGYMDVVAMKCHGLHDAVACMGTAVNRVQLQRVLKKCRRLILCFDGDIAGQEAAWRAAVEVLHVIDDEDKLGFLFMPEGEDPDSWLNRYGVDKWREYQDKKMIEVDEFLYRRLSAGRNFSALSDRADYARQAVALCRSVRSSIYRQLLLDTLAERAGIKNTSLASLTSAGTGSDSGAKRQRYTQTQPARSRIERTKWDDLLSILIEWPSLLDNIGDEDGLLFLDAKRQRVQGNCPNGCLKALLQCRLDHQPADARALLNVLQPHAVDSGEVRVNTGLDPQCVHRLLELA
ncbi:MAG: DNA primase, partial [Proteobacteria bacterium]|nr:DNA primase [Pseudomonadota bacterium]